jgi:hypothetical protein
MYQPDIEQEIKFVFKETFTADMLDSLVKLRDDNKIDPKAVMHVHQGENRSTTVVRFTARIKGGKEE